uniref:Uncharacterized protein n=1 Tax=Anguilla anguilla TaxID=7936 RepID=A0A0E9Q9S2_ANGAN
MDGNGDPTPALRSQLLSEMHRQMERSLPQLAPICRLQVTAANESWVMSDAPTEDDMASYILNLADEAGHPHRP